MISAEPASQAWSRGAFLEWRCERDGGFPNFRLVFFHHETIGVPCLFAVFAWREIDTVSSDPFRTLRCAARGSFPPSQKRARGPPRSSRALTLVSWTEAREAGEACVLQLGEKVRLKNLFRKLFRAHGRTAGRGAARQPAGEHSLAVFNLEGGETRHTWAGYRAGQLDDSVLKLQCQRIRQRLRRENMDDFRPRIGNHKDPTAGGIEFQNVPLNRFLDLVP
jgi:hypothetical protein